MSNPIKRFFNRYDQNSLKTGFIVFVGTIFLSTPFTLWERYNPQAVQDRQDRAYGELIMKALQEKDPVKAIYLYSKAIEIKPASGIAYYHRGAKRQEFGDKQGAIEDYQTAIASGAFRPQGITDEDIEKRIKELKKQP